MLKRIRVKGLASCPTLHATCHKLLKWILGKLPIVVLRF